jgi:uncharacterized protein (DUF2132 family)
MERKSNDPLEGKTLEMIINELVAAYGWEGLAAEVPLRCFKNDPSVKSSLTFLRRTPWARAKVEALYRDHLQYKLDPNS